MKKKVFIVILSMISFGAMAQEKWYRITKNDIALYSCMALSGTADGFNQAIIHHEFGRGHAFTDYITSWRRKYKDAPNGDFRAAYMGSKSWLVWTTDAFHLTRAIDHGAIVASVVIASGDLRKYEKKDRWKVIVFKKALVPMLIKGIFFSAFYHNLGYRQG